MDEEPKKRKNRPGPGRPKGKKTGTGAEMGVPRLLSDMRTVWKAGQAGVHTTPQKQSLHEMMVNKPELFLKQLREMEKEYRDERIKYEERKDKREAAARELQPARVRGGLEKEFAEVKVEDLARRLLTEWREKK